MRKHCENALTFARWLESHPATNRVYYPGLESHPDHVQATKQFRDQMAGGMVSFDLPCGPEDIERFMNLLGLAVPGTSLGDTETLVLYPALSSHRTLTPEERQSVGIGDGLLRVSVGLEAVDDIIADFESAFARSSF